MKIISGVCLILGCFFGAGFVSGREIAFYFSRFGWASLLSVVLTVLLFFVLVLFFFRVSNNVSGMNDFCNVYFGRASRLVDWLLAICVLITSGSMIAGTRSLAESLNFDETFFLIMTIILTFLVVVGNVKSLSRVNMLMVPFLIIVLLMLSTNIGMSGIGIGSVLKAVVSGCNYVLINIVTLGLFIIEIGNEYTNKQKIIISIISSLIIGIVLALLCFAIIKSGLEYEIMPNLCLASCNSLLYFMTQLCIYLGLFTTLVANILILKNFINQYLHNSIISLLLALLLSFGLSFAGFDIIVGYVYSIIGLVGAFVVIYVLKKSKKRRFQISSVS